MLKPFHFALIGVGNAGTVIAKALLQARHRCSFFISKTAKGKLRIKKNFKNAARIYSHISEVSKEYWIHLDILILAVPDDSIGFVGNELAKIDKNLFKKQVFVIHLSGCKKSTEIPKLSWGFRASFHPCTSFAGVKQSAASLEKVYFAIESASETKPFQKHLFRLARDLKGIPFSIKTKDKTLYHLALVFACNYLVTLQLIAQKILKQTDVDNKHIVQLLFPLLNQTINNIKALGISESLTGPIIRNDITTLRDHQKCLKRIKDKNIEELYRLLAEQTMFLSQRKNPKETKKLLKLFEN